MTHVVTEKCVKCKYTDCVSVCPVDCFYEMKNMLIINPDECIDCGVCIDECPIKAISSDVDENEDVQFWINIARNNIKHSKRITQKQKEAAEADKYKDIQHKKHLIYD